VREEGSGGAERGIQVDLRRGYSDGGEKGDSQEGGSLQRGKSCAKGPGEQRFAEAISVGEEAA